MRITFSVTSNNRKEKMKKYTIPPNLLLYFILGVPCFFLAEGMMYIFYDHAGKVPPLWAFAVAWSFGSEKNWSPAKNHQTEDTNGKKLRKIAQGEQTGAVSLAHTVLIVEKGKRPKSRWPRNIWAEIVWNTTRPFWFHLTTKYHNSNGRCYYGI